jgi:hypothetical protein
MLQEGRKILSGGTTLGKTFIKYMTACSKEYVLALQPYSSKTYGTGTQREFASNGLYKIDKVTSHFNINQEVGAFYFKKSEAGGSIQDAFITRTKPTNNLAKYFIRTAGRLPRHEYESTLVEAGAVKVIITPHTIKYSTNPEFADQMQDGTVGTWRVVMALNASRVGIGKTVIARPEDVLSNSVVCMVVKSEEEAVQLKEYIDQPEISAMLAEVKTTNTNTAKYFEYISTPDFLLN